MARYAKGRWDETHKRIVRFASERFRKDGIDGIGVAALMAGAGLTHGGFYAHFASKEALLDEALAYALDALYGTSSGADGSRNDLAGLIDWYLSPAHRDHPGKGCPLAALAPELARRPKAARNAFAKASQIAMDRIVSGLRCDPGDEDAITTADALMAQLLGALQLSRLVVDKDRSDGILKSGRRIARQIAGIDEPPPSTAQDCGGR